MERKAQILNLADSHGIIRVRDVEASGIPRTYIYRLCADGVLEKIGRGLYCLPNTQHTEHLSLMEAAKRVPNSVICLISALEFHGITTQIPSEIWIAVKKGAWRPDFKYPPLNITYVSGIAFGFGIREHDLNGVAVKIYSPAKTVADCFKFRNKVGVDVAVEALRELWRARMATMDELVEAAKVCRVSRVIRPYLESLV